MKWYILISNAVICAADVAWTCLLAKLKASCLTDRWALMLFGRTQRQSVIVGIVYQGLTS